jgi:transcriptional regulator with XRE-family HTH domain
MEQLAKMAGVSFPSVSKYEGDKQSPTLYTAQCLADVLDISIDWLACRTDKVEV